MDYFFLLTLGFCSGVILRSFVSFDIPTASLIFLFSLLSLILYRYERVQMYLIASLFLCAAFVGAGRTIFAEQGLPQIFAESIGTNVTYTGVIVADPDIRDTNQHLMIDVAENGENMTILAFAPLFPSFVYGEHVTVSGTLQEPEPFATDGGRTFDYQKFLAKDRVFAIVPQARVQSISPPEGISRTFGILFSLKHSFTDGLKAALPEPSAALAEGLLTGGKQGLGKDLMEAFIISGLIQIVVLSGYNVMIVAEAVLRSLSFLPKRTSILFAGVSIMAFVIAAGSGAAALRAGLMACIALYARATGRTYNALRGLFLALILLVLWNPLSLVYDPGFQLSFVATLGLIIGTPVVEPRLAFIKNALLRDVTATTLAAQIAVLPLLLHQTGNLSLVSVIANVLVTPFIPIAMAAGFIAGIAGVIAPVLAPIIGLPAFVLLSYIVAVAEYSSALPMAHIIIPAFPFIVVLAAYVVLWFNVRKEAFVPIRLLLSEIASRTRSS